jgi:hypothetical protein
VCLESTQIDSYLNLSEDRESKSYHRDPVATSSPNSWPLGTMSLNGVLGSTGFGCTRNAGPPQKGATCRRMTHYTPVKPNQDHRCCTRNGKLRFVQHTEASRSREITARLHCSLGSRRWSRSLQSPHRLRPSSL